MSKRKSGDAAAGADDPGDAVERNKKQRNSNNAVAGAGASNADAQSDTTWEADFAMSADISGSNIAEWLKHQMNMQMSTDEKCGRAADPAHVLGPNFTLRPDPWILSVGSCQFESLADQLLLRERLTLQQWERRRKREADALRAEVVSWLRANADWRLNTADPHTALRNYVMGDYKEFCDNMSQPLAWGDHMTLIATCQVKHCVIHVYHDRAIDQGQAGTTSHLTIIRPRGCDDTLNLPVLRVWHWHERHYGSVVPTVPVAATTTAAPAPAPANASAAEGAEAHSSPAHAAMPAVPTDHIGDNPMVQAGKRMRSCLKCKHSISASAAYCEKCGAPQGTVNSNAAKADLPVRNRVDPQSLRKWLQDTWSGAYHEPENSKTDLAKKFIPEVFEHEDAAARFLANRKSDYDQLLTNMEKKEKPWRRRVLATLAAPGGGKSRFLDFIRLLCGKTFQPFIRDTSHHSIWSKMQLILKSDNSKKNKTATDEQFVDRQQATIAVFFSLFGATESSNGNQTLAGACAFDVQAAEQIAFRLVHGAFLDDTVPYITTFLPTIKKMFADAGVVFTTSDAINTIRNGDATRPIMIGVDELFANATLAPHIYAALSELLTDGNVDVLITTLRPLTHTPSVTEASKRPIEWIHLPPLSLAATEMKLCL